MLEKFRKLTSKQLSHLAFAVWISSLILCGMVSYAHVEWSSGFYILLIGWISPIDPSSRNFAWYANFFFIVGVLLLHFSKRSAVLFSIMAAIISIDTIRFSIFVLNAAGQESPLYGYGWGAVAWFLSLCILLMAAGTRQVEKRMTSGSKWVLGTSLRPLGVVLGIMVISISCYWAVSDRMQANAEELERLGFATGVAFKHGLVCRDEIETVGKPIERFNGILEVVAKEDLQLAEGLFNDPDRLLDWGVRVVRVDGFDYSLSKLDSRGDPEPSHALGLAGAKLMVGELMNNTAHIHLKMIETARGRIVFEETWSREHAEFSKYCPGFCTYCEPDEQPRKLLIQALGLPNESAKNKSN